MIVLAMAILLFSASPKDDSDGFKKSVDALTACMIQSTMDLDDGRSDAATIAMAVTSACQMDLEVWKSEVWRLSESPGSSRDFKAEMDREIVPGMVLKGVLDYRRVRAKYLGRQNQTQ